MLDEANKYYYSKVDLNNSSTRYRKKKLQGETEH